jgi:tetratricopeptide (TPR) repeat protein
LFDVKRLFAGFRPAAAPRGPLERGIAELQAGRLEAARAAFSEAEDAASGPQERARALNKRGVALVALGRQPDALADFCDALAADERCAPALVNLGNLLLETGHPHDAIDYYEAALRADEGYGLAYGNLGAAYKRIGRRSDAVRCLRLAARIAARRPAGRS